MATSTRPTTPLVRSMLLLLAAYVVLCVYFALYAPNFVSSVNILNILRQAAMVGIIGVGMTMVIVCAEIDLSVGSVAALSGIVVAWMSVN